MTPSLPPATIWEQYGVVAIIVVVVALVLIAAWKVFKEYRAWQSEEQKLQRAWQEEQSKVQREWQAEQNKIRDEEQLKRDQRWQEQVKDMNISQVEQDKQTANVLSKVLERMDALTMVLTLHDERAKEAIKDLLKK